MEANLETEGSKDKEKRLPEHSLNVREQKREGRKDPQNPRKKTVDTEEMSKRMGVKSIVLGNKEKENGKVSSKGQTKVQSLEGKKGVLDGLRSEELEGHKAVGPKGENKKERQIGQQGGAIIGPIQNQEMEIDGQYELSIKGDQGGKRVGHARIMR